MLWNRLREARRAYARRDLEAARKAHEPGRIVESLEEPEIHNVFGGRYIGDMVYGASDGLVTTFAVVSGVAGAALSPGIVLILGFANLFGDGLSMAVGNYLGSKSELDYQRRERARETWEIEHIPEGEKEEVRRIYAAKGFSGQLLDQVVEVITADKDRWVETMMLEELHILPEQGSPFKSGLMTFVSFVIAGFVPLLAYVLSYWTPFFARHAFGSAILFTALTIFAVGSLRTYVTGKRWWVSGLEMLFVAGTAALVAYGIGYLLKGLA